MHTFSKEQAEANYRIATVFPVGGIPRPAAREIEDPLVRQYGLGGRNYAKARELKIKSDEAKAWQDANTAPEAGGAGIIPYGPDLL